jgi:hypothetical protein
MNGEHVGGGGLGKNLGGGWTRKRRRRVELSKRRVPGELGHGLELLAENDQGRRDKVWRPVWWGPRMCMCGIQLCASTRRPAEQRAGRNRTIGTTDPPGEQQYFPKLI